MEMIDYYPAPDVRKRIEEIVGLLRFEHVILNNLHCVRSRGSKAKRTIARIHGRSRIWQAVGLDPAYVIEIIVERFDRLSPEDQDRTLIHELLHIPHGFKGGSGITGATSTTRLWRPGTGGTARRGTIDSTFHLYSGWNQGFDVSSPIRFLASSTYSMLLSTPMKCRSVRRAATHVVPLPQKGSRTTSPR